MPEKSVILSAIEDGEKNISTMSVSDNEFPAEEITVSENSIFLEDTFLLENNAFSSITVSENSSFLENNTVIENSTLSENNTVVENSIFLENNTIIESNTLSEKAAVSKNSTLSENHVVSDNNIFLEENKGLVNSAEENVLTLKVEEKVIGNYSKWSEAMEAVKEIADVTQEYTIEISANLDLEEKLTIPSKIGRLNIKGTDKNRPVTLSYIGDMKLTSNVSIDSIELKAKKYNNQTKSYNDYLSIITLNGKELILKNCTAKLASVNGNSKATFYGIDSTIIIDKALSGVGYVNLDNSYLKAQTVSITSVFCTKSSILESESKITIKNIISNDEKNKIIYQDNASKNLLNITGNISSETSEEDEKILRKSNVEGTEITESAIIRKNAITLQINTLEEEGYTKGILLGNVSKAGAAWFVIGSQWEQVNGETVRVVKDVTYKVNTKLYCGSVSDNVILYSSKDEEDSFALESSFMTLQEAFNEIDKIGDSSKYYRILLNNSQEGTATFSNKSLKFPTKTKGILVRKSSKIQEGNLYFKGNITLKSNVIFEDIIFRNIGKSNVSLGKYTLYLKNCYSNENPEAVEFNNVTGNSVKKTSELILEDTILEATGMVNNIGQVRFLSQGTEEEMTANSVEENVLRVVPAYPEITANGKINIGNIVLDTDAKITGIAKITRKKEIISKITPDIIINGEITSEKSKNLYLDLKEKTGTLYSMLDFTALEMEDWKHEKGIQVAKALYNKYPNVYLFQNNQYRLIKKAGYFTYYDTGKETTEEFYGAEVSFITEGKEETIYCHSFSDAVTEINNQKEKRDYTITLKKEVEDSSAKAPQNLKFPTKKYVNSLLIRGEEQEENVKLAYLGNLTFTSPVVLQNVSFVQMVKVKGEYKEAAKVKEDYPGVVTIRLSGFDLNIEGSVDFDTPIKIDGGNKGNLILNGNLNTYTNDFEESMTKEEYVIYGMLTNIQTLSLSDKTLSLREVRNSRTGKKYTPSNNKITNLYMEDDAVLEITGVSNKNSLTVQNVSIFNSEITVEGTGKFKNVTLSGEQEAVIRVDSIFNITGNLEVKTDNGRLETRRKGNGKEPYLNISGKVFREENRNPVYVGVYYEMSAGEIMGSQAVKLTNAPKATAQLLTAKNASVSDFRPIEENYPGGEFSDTNTNGYVMVKKGTKVYVYSGETYFQN